MIRSVGAWGVDRKRRTYQKSLPSTGIVTMTAADDPILKNDDLSTVMIYDKPLLLHVAQDVDKGECRACSNSMHVTGAFSSRPGRAALNNGER